MKRQVDHTEILCKECGQPMVWLWSQGAWDQGAWVIRCSNAGVFAKEEGCFMCGDAFRPETYERDFALHRAMRVIRRSRSGIIYRNPEGTVNEWICEAVERGILCSSWRSWGEAAL